MSSAHPLFAHAADVCLWLSRWLDSAETYLHTLALARGKRHGAGAVRWVYAHRAAAAARWVTYGQSRGHRPPRWMRKALEHAREPISNNQS